MDTFKELYVNFLDETHVTAILQMYFELEDSYNEEDLDLMTRRLLCTLQYYIKLARLTDVQREILDLKIKKKTNNYSVRNAEFTAFLTKLSCMQ